MLSFYPAQAIIDCKNCAHRYILVFMICVASFVCCIRTQCAGGIKLSTFCWLDLGTPNAWFLTSRGFSAYCMSIYNPWDSKIIQFGLQVVIHKFFVNLGSKFKYLEQKVRNLIFNVFSVYKIFVLFVYSVRLKQ